MGIFSKAELNNMLSSEIVSANRELKLERLLKNPLSIPYLYKDESSNLKIQNLIPYSRANVNYPLILDNFCEGIKQVKDNLGNQLIISRVIFDPCGFGLRPIGDPSEEGPRTFLSASLQSATREVGLNFILIRGYCGDTPSYKVESFENGGDVLEIMRSYVQVGKSPVKKSFIPFRLEK